MVMPPESCPLGCPGDPLIGCDHCYNPNDPCDCRSCRSPRLLELSGAQFEEIRGWLADHLANDENTPDMVELAAKFGVGRRGRRIPIESPASVEEVRRAAFRAAAEIASDQIGERLPGGGWDDGGADVARLEIVRLLEERARA